MYKPGDYYVICDMSGEKVYRSECVKQWDGLIVKREYADARHPLDLQKPPKGERVPKETRPESVDLFIGDDVPNVTADDL